MDAKDPSVVEHGHPTVLRASVEGWPLRWKVAATMALPVVLAATFGGIRIQNELSAASKLSVASDNAGSVGPAVEFVDRLDTLAYAAASGAPIQEPLAQFDASASALGSLITSAEFDPAVAADLAAASSTAKTLRDEIASGPVPQPRIAEGAEDVANEVVSAITATTATVGDDAVRPLADQLVSVLAAQRALSTQRVLAAAPDYADSVALRTDVAEAAGAEAAAIDRLAELSSTGEDAALRGPSDLRREAYTRPLGEPLDPVQFGTAVQASDERYRTLVQDLSADLEQTVHARANELRSAALRDTAIILGAVLAALVLALWVGRSLIRSVGRLRRGALQVAQVQLPEEIERLSKGEGVPQIAELPVHTNEELGQLARAIDDIHFQAVRLAGEHGVRLQIGEMFETLSRRSRSLVEEQLALIETLELDEDDPARLDHLFRLDHLATRMRRNGDNLLVLADTVERHRRSAPAPLLEVLRAAMSEVEDYHRVKLGHTVDGAIVGAAAGDVGHLIAELLDNALRYSPPESLVSMTVARAVDAGVLIEVADRGLGMSTEDLRAANERLAQGGEVTSETAKRMGLFVVGRLARRHDATVRMRTTAALTDRPGVTVSVHLPGALLAPPDDIVGPLDDSRAGAFASPQTTPLPSLGVINGAASNGSEVPGHDGAALPKRSPGASGVNGASRADGAHSANGVNGVNGANGVAAGPVWSKAESDGAPIFERMTSEWMMDPTTRRDTAWVSESDAAWTAAAKAVEQKPKRHTESGLPIRERGARLVPENAGPQSGPRADAGPDPTAIRNVLSRQLAGVRRGRAETDSADRQSEGDR